MTCLKTILDPRNVGLLALACLTLCGLLTACIPPEAQPRKLSEKEALEFSLDQPTALDDVSFRQSKKGKPEDVGCADGQREGFANLERFPNVAGCLARWEGKQSLRTPVTGTACGDDNKTKCESPGDVCAEGWHLCGVGGSNEDLATRVTGEECNTEAGPGKFVAAMSHLQEPKVCPPLPTKDTVFDCLAEGIGAESVCCGDGCTFGKCRHGVWKSKTKISRGKAEGCGSSSARRNGGLLCCRDELLSVADASR